MDFAAFIDTQKVILLDGAMGTQLAKRGAEPGIANINAPEKVMEVHQEHIGCGSHAVITNTLTMNRVYIETHGLDINVQKVNIAGAQLARKVVGESLYVLGNLSSTGQMLEPYGTFKEADFYEAFKEQAAYLAEGGVDGFIIETMFDMREALCALRACKDAASLPVIVSMSFSTLDGGGRTIMGNSAEQIAREMTSAGADAVGTNCGDLDPIEISKLVLLLADATSIPIIAEPNAGKPKLVAGKTVFDMDPPTFAEGVAKCVENGARIVGGCCGTAPEHICALTEKLGLR